jgi:hypothetical protein
MDIMNLKQLHDEMEKIIAAVCAEDSVPAMIMKATRANNSKDWDEAGDARRFDEHVAEGIDQYEKAVKVLVGNTR